MTDVLIVGAGPAGLAVGACLVQRGLKPVLLEGSDRVGDSWHRHYRRLHLHTARRHSNLPRHSMPSEWPVYPSRAQVTEYLTEYAQHFGLEPLFGHHVERIERTEDGWSVRTDRSTHRSARVVVATGYNRAPKLPTWADQGRFLGPVLHSKAFEDGEPFRGKRVLVVGLGNTGGEIALDLLEHGATPTLSVRNGVNVIPRDMFGRPAQETGILMEALGLPEVAGNVVTRLVSRLTFGDLTQYGLPPAPIGVASQIARGHIPLIDVGTVAKVKSGEIGVAPGIDRFTETGALFVDGKERAFDAVVLATGYTSALEQLLVGAEAVLDERGLPRVELGDEPAPGLFFIGFVNPPTGFLRRIAIDAERLAAKLTA